MKVIHKIVSRYNIVSILFYVVMVNTPFISLLWVLNNTLLFDIPLFWQGVYSAIALIILNLILVHDRDLHKHKKVIHVIEK